MIRLTDRQLAEFAHRSYQAVDGLWFMKVEARYGLDAALDVDNEVWKVLPKIQARMLKSMANVDTGVDALRECLTARLDLEGFVFEVEESETGDGFRLSISRCPWHDAMMKSGREALSGKINSLICNTEYTVWAGEFGPDIRFEPKDRICTGSGSCLLQFRTPHAS